jgi:hypothetical protein
VLNTDPVNAVQFVRKMRGSAKAHLLRGDDGHHYVVKFSNGPQGPRIPVNEWIASHLLRSSGIQTPQPAVIRITPEFLGDNPDVHLGDRDERVAVEPGLHFGSRYPGDPASTAVYDFLPDSLLAQTANLDQFRAILVFDKWLGNTDARQCVFYRTRTASERRNDERPRWVASMIDNGHAFGGARWNFTDSPAQGVYCRPSVYRNVRSLDDFQPWLDQVAACPEGLIEEARTMLPVECVGRNQDDLNRLLDRLVQRRDCVPELLRKCCEGAPKSFPSWSPVTIHSVPAKVEAAVDPLMRMVGWSVPSTRLVPKLVRAMPLRRLERTSGHSRSPRVPLSATQARKLLSPRHAGVKPIAKKECRANGSPLICPAASGPSRRPKRIRPIVVLRHLWRANLGNTSRAPKSRPVSPLSKRSA